jgi:hypothetical protein
VPLRNARDDGGSISVPFDKAQVKDEPKMDPDGELSREQERELYRYYDVGASGTAGAAADRDDAMTRSEDDFASAPRNASPAASGCASTSSKTRWPALSRSSARPTRSRSPTPSARSRSSSTEDDLAGR